MSQYLLMVICWGAFFIVWLAGAIYNHYKIKVISRRQTNYIKILLLTIFVVWLIGKYIPNDYWKLLSYSGKWLKVTGSLLLICSTIFTIWSRLVLGKMWSSDAVIKEGHKLHIEGPYSITRHPIYTGILGMLLGSMLMKDFDLAVIVYFISILILLKFKIKNEEKILIETFGEEYLNFKKIIPQLFPTLKSLKNMII